MTKIEEFLKICRACNNEKTNLLNLFAVDCEDEPTLGEKFIHCTSLSVAEHDEMPQNICYPCAKLLESAYKFNKMCRRTDVDLRKRLSAIKVDPEIEEPEGDFCELEALDSPLYLEENCDEDEGDGLDDYENSKRLSSPQMVVLEEDVLVPQTVNPSSTNAAGTSDRQYVCDECDKRFYTSKALELHIKVHHKKFKKIKIEPSKSFQRQSSLEECTECDLVFGSRDEYKDHMRLCHLNESTDNTCEICGKRLRNKIAFKNHLKVHASENRPYVCNVCGKEYTEYRYMYRHMLYHKQTLFRCTEKACTRKYTVKHKLVDHLRRHHQKLLTNIEVRKIQPESLQSDEIYYEDIVEEN